MGLIVAIVLFAGLKALVRRGQRSARVTTHGSARWASLHDLSQTDNLSLALDSTRFLFGVAKQPILYRTNILGRRKHRAALTLRRFWNSPLAYPLIVTGTKDATVGRPDDGHCLTIAGSGAGKGVAVVQPNLWVYGGSTVTFDPKGENFMHTFDARLAHGNRVYLVDPFHSIPADLRKRYGIRLNPLQPLEAYYLAGQHAEVYDEAGGIADLLVVVTGKEMQPHFNDKAKAIIRCAILFATYADIYQDRSKFPLNLTTVKDVIDNWFLERDKHKLLAGICKRSPHLRSIPGTVSGMAGEEFLSVMATVLNHTDLLNSPYVRESLSASDFRPGDLKREKVSLYLVLPANQLKTYGRLARLWVGTLLRAMMQSAAPTRHRTLFMLDELAQLGKLDPLLQAITLGRGYGIDVYMIFQDMAQMQAAYGDSFRSLFSNAKYQQFFGIRDLATAKEISERLGKETLQTVSVADSRSRTRGGNSGHSSGGRDGSSSRGTSWSDTNQVTATESSIARELLTPDEVLTLPETDLILMMADRLPVRAQKFDVRRTSHQSALRSFAGSRNPRAAIANDPVRARLPKPEKLRLHS